MKKCIFALVLAVLSFLTPSFAQTCECPAAPKSVRESFSQAGVVVAGSVQKFGKSPIRPGMNEVVIKIMSRYKGLEDVKANTLYIYTPETKQKCGINFLVSQDYLIYADGNAARPVAVSCSRTDVLDNALGQLEELQKLGSRK